MRQVWLNLLLNSLDASIAGQTVTIRLVPNVASGGGFEGGEHHMVEVLDEGSGLPPDLGADIFEPFVTISSRPSVRNSVGVPQLEISSRSVRQASVRV